MPSVTVLKKLYELTKAQYKWTESLPNEISIAFIDNPLVDGCQHSIDLLVNAYFGEEWNELICNILHEDEVSEESPLIFSYDDGTEFKLSSINEICAHLIKYEEWTE